MPVEINFSASNRVTNVITDTVADIIPSNMFGQIALSVVNSLDPDSRYDGHFIDVVDYLSSGLIRFPGGEMPDGFAYRTVDRDGNEIWQFQHNGINGGGDYIFDPITGGTIPWSSNPSYVDQVYLDSLTPAFSLRYPELIHPSLLESEGEGVITFSESLQIAIDSNATYTLVLPEFQYLKIPVDRDPDRDEIKTPFAADDHVKVDELISDVTNFLEDLFINGIYNNGNIPDDFVLEIGNESYFGWNENLFDPDSWVDLDSYSAYAYSILTAVKDFRVAHPDISFRVAMQANRGGHVDELERNFNDENALDLFGEIDVISVAHDGLDITLNDAIDLSDRYSGNGAWSMYKSITRMLDLIENGGGDSSNTDIYMSAWSATSHDIYGDTNGNHQNHRLPAAGATLGLFSSMFELGIDMAANWGAGSWDGLGTNSTDIVEGQIVYAPYIEAYRLMAESIIGTHQINTPTMNGGREVDFNTYAYEDDAKAVIFLSANNYSGLAEINLTGFGHIGYIWIERISEELLPNGEYQTVITRESINYSPESFSVTFNSPYEVIRVIVAHENPGEGYLHLWGSQNGDLLRGGVSDDLLEGNEGDDTILGNDGNDIIIGGTGNDILHGHLGDDLISGGLGDDILEGGLGRDRFIFEPNSGNDVIVDFRYGFDTLDIKSFFGGQNIMSINVNGDMFLLHSSGRNESSTSYEMEVTTQGNDTHIMIRDNSGTAVLSLILENVPEIANPEEFLSNFVFEAPIFIQPMNSVTPTYAGENLFYGTENDDIISGGPASNYIFGDIGADYIEGGAGGDYLYGGEGNDIIFGGTGYDYISGGNGDDVLYGGEDGDLIMGGDGNDILYGGLGSNMMEGGDGNDTFVFSPNSSFSTNYISDFNTEEDIIRIQGVNFSDLSIDEFEGYIEISWGANSVELDGVSGSQVNESWFQFV